MKVLILAEVCNPGWPSLPGFSFSLASSIAENTPVVLVTHIRNKANLVNQTTKFDEIIYIDNEYIASPLDKLSKFLRKLGIGGWMTNMGLRYPAYISFEKIAYKRLRKRLESSEFDIVHRISPVSPTLPSPFATLTSIPFILGPLNGSLAWPHYFKEAIKKEREIVSHIRNIYKFLPYYKSSFASSQKILAAFKHVEKDIPKGNADKIIRFNELGVDIEHYKPKAESELGRLHCQFLFVGRLVPYKGADVVIKAFANSEYLRTNHSLTIVGDGPERTFLEGLIEKFNLEQCVKLVGWKTQDEVPNYMVNADVFAFPTIREVGGNVIIEAMAAGLPCVVPDYGGPSELVNDTIGIKIPLVIKDEFDTLFMQAMEKLAKDKLTRKQLSINARQEAINKHSWKVRGRQAFEIYRSVLEQK